MLSIPYLSLIYYNIIYIPYIYHIYLGFTIYMGLLCLIATYKSLSVTYGNMYQVITLKKKTHKD